MKFSNFRNPVVTGTSILNKNLTADIDVTTGHLFWKKTRTRRIGREAMTFYVFLDTGERLLASLLNLELTYRIQHGLDDFF